jgi:hypothetical protein
MAKYKYDVYETHTIAGTGRTEYSKKFNNETLTKAYYKDSQNVIRKLSKAYFKDINGNIKRLI